MPDLEIIPVESLTQLVNHLSNIVPIEPTVRTPTDIPDAPPDRGLQEIKGQEHAKRALEVAAPGGYNLLMLG